MTTAQRPAKDSPFKAANTVHDVAFSIGAEGASRVVSMQFKDALGNEVYERVSCFAYLSDDAEGDDIAVTAPDTVAAGTDGVYIPIVAGKAFQLVSEVDGDMDLEITENGADTWYLNVVMPDGRIVTSGAIEFAA